MDDNKEQVKKTPNKITTFSREGNSTSTNNKFGSKPRPREFKTMERVKPEFEQKIVEIRRVTRVVAGGRRLRFSVSMVIGDKKGSIGFGLGKAGDTSIAITKALRDAKKNMVKVALTKTNSIPHIVEAKYNSSKLIISPNRGRGLVAGSAVRDALSLGGINNVTAKIHSPSKNRINNVRAVIKALMKVGEKRIVLN